MNSQNQESTPISDTPTQRLATTILGQNVNQFIADRRANGRAWRLIERDLRDATAGQIDVTHETLRAWHLAAAA